MWPDVKDIVDEPKPDNRLFGIGIDVTFFKIGHEEICIGGGNAGCHRWPTYLKIVIPIKIEVVFSEYQPK